MKCNQSLAGLSATLLHHTKKTIILVILLISSHKYITVYHRGIHQLARLITDFKIKVNQIILSDQMPLPVLLLQLTLSKNMMHF